MVDVSKQWSSEAEVKPCSKTYSVGIHARWVANEMNDGAWPPVLEASCEESVDTYFSQKRREDGQLGETVRDCWFTVIV